eukprot:CAMPEP_0115463344 /NCGR_PEP_ID=MMETSP0271-20121206/48299_1 /TAXON_ID=71861 /ORGANISM="Scrippsiella trochoidea, Strain CCMP3099" /LENGTH=293 /DNA_ID=CAMNT_0002890175 /DNA_START=167 /DNA_END=1047 /DNA_ORIENTATION=-
MAQPTRMHGITHGTGSTCGSKTFACCQCKRARVSAAPPSEEREWSLDVPLRGSALVLLRGKARWPSRGAAVLILAGRRGHDGLLPWSHEAALALVVGQSRSTCSNGVPKLPVITALQIHARVYASVLAILGVQLTEPSLVVDSTKLHGQPLSQVAGQHLSAGKPRLLTNMSAFCSSSALRVSKGLDNWDVRTSSCSPAGASTSANSAACFAGTVTDGNNLNLRSWHLPEGLGSGEEVSEGSLDQAAKVALFVFIFCAGLTGPGPNLAQHRLHDCEVQPALHRHPMDRAFEGNL